MDAVRKKLVFYRDPEGHEPFVQWLESIVDITVRYRVIARLNRVEVGNFGDHASVGGGVFELRLQFGPGYRIYYGEDGNQIVILLCGGSKKGQNKDIRKAKIYWRDYAEKEK